MVIQCWLFKIMYKRPLFESKLLSSQTRFMAVYWSTSLKIHDQSNGLHKILSVDVYRQPVIFSMPSTVYWNTGRCIPSSIESTPTHFFNAIENFAC